MKTTKSNIRCGGMSTILILGLGLMVWSAPMVYAAQYLTVNGQDVTSITLELGQSRTVEVVSTDSTSYTAYLGFDYGVVLGDFSHLETKPEAGNLATVADYNQPAFYGYYLSVAGFSPAPSPGVHFVFQYEAQELGTTNVKLYDGALTSVTDAVHITVIRPKMGTAFSYQGRLMDDNEAAEGLYDFQFKLYDYISGGSQLGSTIDINDLDVIDGHFAVDLDFGSGIFDGDAVWLETTVAQGDGNDPCTLKPRVELTPTPYALYAKTAHPGHSLDAADGSPTDSVYVDDNGNVGIGTTNPDEKLTVEGTIKVSNTKPSGYGVYSEATNSGNYVNFGGYFAAAGYNGAGVYGYATGGVGVGVYGEAANTGNYTNYGGFFRAEGITGRGVTGWASNNGNYVNYGGHFKAEGATGRGVYGEATYSGNSTNYGGYFKAAGFHGKAVYGYATGGGGQGVYGYAANTGNYQNYGGYFAAAGRGGRGVYGKATNSGNYLNFGGYFAAAGRDGRGVSAFATGSNGKGVQAWGKQYDFCASGPGLNYGSGSSIRWKTNISPIDEPLEKLILLRGVYFNWDADHGGHHDVGMIAEEVGEVMPEIVVYEENGIDANGMDYSKLTPLLVEAVKELKVENDSLKVRVEALERTMLQLAKVKELEL